MIRRLTLLLATLALATTASAQRPVAKDRPAGQVSPAERAIVGETILRDTRALSADAFLGRAVATAGEDSAVAWISRRFREIGLAPAGDDGGYAQRVPLVGTRSRAQATLHTADVVESLRYLEDFVVWSHATDTLVRPESTGLVFVGYGVHAPEIGWDDYKGADVRGKVVVMLIGDPPVPDPRDPSKLDTAVFRGAAMTYYGRWTYKFEEAARRGAAAVLLVHQTGPAGYGWSVVQSNDRERFEVEGAGEHVAVEGWIHLDLARRVVTVPGRDFAALEREAATRAFRPVELERRIAFTVRNTVRRVQSRNVVAKLVGSDAGARDEAVLYSSHWDGYGVGRPIDGDSIYNGALDDASGVAAMLSIATAFRRLPRAPRRSVVFVAFTAEEQGLLGARWYARHPAVPLARTVADINLDAMNPWGRTRSLVSLGHGQTELEDLLAEEAARDGRRTVPDAEPEKGYFYRADHLELARGGVPALSFLFPGIDYLARPAAYGDSVRAAYIARDYHKPSDEVKPDWDAGGLVDDARLLFRVGLRVASGREWPEWKPGTEFRAAREASRKP